MHKIYAKAIFDLLEKNGFGNISEVLENFKRYAQKTGKSKILPKVKFELLRLFDAYQKKLPYAEVAKESDLPNAKKKAELLSWDIARYKINPNLIGGFKIKYGNRLFDASYKKYLLDLYSQLRKVD